MTHNAEWYAERLAAAARLKKLHLAIHYLEYDGYTPYEWVVFFASIASGDCEYYGTEHYGRAGNTLLEALKSCYDALYKKFKANNYQSGLVALTGRHQPVGKEEVNAEAVTHNN